MNRWSISEVLAGMGAWLGLLIAMPTAVVAMERANGPGHRVVIHVNSGDELVHQAVLNNVRHLHEAVGAEPLKVEVVAHGAGLALLTKKDSTVREQLAHLKQHYGVEFTACSNTMKAQGLVRTDLVNEVDRTVPAMRRLMELQEQGWAYIKP